MEDNIVLKPCPFCGSSVDIEYPEVDKMGEPAYWHIFCECQVLMEDSDCDNLAEKWNTRTDV